MTSDIELLLAAAKVAGIEAEYHYGCGEALCLIQPSTTLYWNPLRDDAQAFQLANALMLIIHHAELTVVVNHKSNPGEWVWEDVNVAHKCDRNSAARRAIVRAAAAIAARHLLTNPQH